MAYVLVQNVTSMPLVVALQSTPGEGNGGEVRRITFPGSVPASQADPVRRAGVCKIDQSVLEECLRQCRSLQAAFDRGALRKVKNADQELGPAEQGDHMDRTLAPHQRRERHGPNAPRIVTVGELPSRPA